MNSKNLRFGKRFDRVAEEFDKISHPYTTMRRKEALIEPNPGKMIDVGTGSGLIVAAVPRDSRVVGTDISFEMCRVTKRNHGVPTVCCDAEYLPFCEEIFDTVIASEVVHYLEEPDRFIQEAYRILRSGGRLSISIFNQNMVFIDRVRTWLRRLRLPHTYFDDGLREFLPLRSLQRLLQNQDRFRIDSVEKCVILPFRWADRINRIIERTLLRRFAMFIIVKATKK